ncbi:MAG: hypothetical protein EOM20_03980 [Spartobacteria bacterium]|nr:hypothetical protein [Spartobacteria bacterium]
MHMIIRFTRLITGALFLLLLFNGCEMPHRPATPHEAEPTPIIEAIPLVEEEIPPDFLVASFDQPEQIVLFSDREEMPTSSTVFHKQETTGHKGQALRLAYDIESYAGLAIDLPPQDLSAYNTLTLWARKPVECAPSVKLQITDTSDLRQRMHLTPYLKKVGAEWVQLDIPLASLDQFAGTAMSHVRQIALVFHAGQGQLELDEITLRKTDITMHETKLPYPEKTTRSLPHGTAAWCYGDPREVVEQVRAYNATAADEHKIRYLFPYAGSIEFTQEAGYSMSWHPTNAHFLAEALGPEMMIMPMIDGLSHLAEFLEPETWEQLALDITRRLDADDLLYGLQLDIEPFDTVLHQLFARLMEHTDKPITTAAGLWTQDTFRYTDMIVLMGYDWAYTPDTFSAKAGNMIPRFLQDAEQAGGKAMVGLPAIATHHEFESYALTEGGPRTSTGYTMAEYVQRAMQITQSADAPGDVFVGYCLWAFHPADGLHGPRDTKWYFPSLIEEDVWKLLR